MANWSQKEPLLLPYQILQDNACPMTNIILLYARIPLSQLIFGANRPQSWWDSQPKFVEMQKIMVEAIRETGDIKYPLSARNIKDDGMYTVEVGSQRLQALTTVGAIDAPCIVHCLEGQTHIPEGRILRGKRQVLEYFGGKSKRFVLNERSLQVVPLDVDDWDPHRVL